MVLKGRKKAVVSSSSSISDEAAAGKMSSSACDHQHNKVMKEQEKFPSLADIENEGGEEGKEKGEGEEKDGGEKGDSDEEKRGKDVKENSLEEEGNVGAEMEGKAERIQKLPEGFYEVEAIRDKRYHKGQPQYLIKWCNYPETDNTWEPYDNIIYCTDMLETFEQSSQTNSRKGNNALPKKKYPIQTEDGGDGTAAHKSGEDSSPVYVVEEGKRKAKGKQKLVEDFYEVETIRKKCYQNDQPQHPIKRHDYPETNNTCEPYDKNYCANPLEAFDQSSWKHKRKRNSALSKKKHSMQTKDGKDDTTTEKGGQDIIVYQRGRGRVGGSGTTSSAKREIIVYQRRHKLRIDSLVKKGKNIMKDQTEKEKATEDKPTTNKVPAPMPELKKRVEDMNNEGSSNFVMQDYVRKQREKEEAKSGVGSTYFSIFFPDYKANTLGNKEAPPLPPFVRTMPDFYSPSQPQGSKASTRLTGAKKRKSGRVRRFFHPNEEAKKTMNAEVMDPTEVIATPSAVDTATNSNSEKATEEVQGSHAALPSNPI